jgi:hypothetical protein
VTDQGRERVITAGPGGRILTNCNVWSPDGEWIAYDTRSDPAGDVFDGTRIEAVNVRTRAVRVLYESRHGANCGVVTWHPTLMRVAFILGPEHPTPDWTYGPARRQGVTVDFDRPGVATPLDARDLIPPFTPGALRGGSHVHVWSPDGSLVSFTYTDHVQTAGRTIGVSVVGRPVTVPKTHPRNHDGSAFSVLVVTTVADPRPGSDDLGRAFEEGWVGTDGYLRPDGTRQKRALAFQGRVRAAGGQLLDEVFVADLPDAPTASPAGVCRRLTFTTDRPYPGIRGPRHWLRSSPDGSRIGFLMTDDAGVVQFWTVSPNGPPPTQVTRNPHPVGSAFTWHPDGRRVAFVRDGAVWLTDVNTGRAERVSPPATDPAHAPRPEACVISPDGSQVAFVRQLPDGAGLSNQICVARLD